MPPININEKQFQELIAGETPVLVDFWAPWCTYCRRITTPYEMLAQQDAGKVHVTKVNIDEEPLLPHPGALQKRTGHRLCGCPGVQGCHGGLY